MDKLLLLLAAALAGISLVLFHPRWFNRPLTKGLRWMIAFLQLAPLLLLVWLLGDPRAQRQETVERDRFTLLLLDDSPSMSFSDGETGAPRLDTAGAWTVELAQSLSSVGSANSTSILRLSELVPSGRSASDFAEAFGAIQERFPIDSLGAIVFVSDGQDRSDREVRRVAQQMNVPVHTIGIGPTLEPNSLRTAFVEVPDSVQPGTPFLVKWSLDSFFDALQPATARLTFASREVFFRNLELREGLDHREDWVSIAPFEPGVFALTLEVEAPRSSLPASVAQATVTVENVPPTVLVLESIPTRNVRSLTQAALDSGRYRVTRPVPLKEGAVGVWDLFRPAPSSMEKTPVPWERESFRRYSREEWETQVGAILSEAAVVVLGESPWSGIPESLGEKLEKVLSDTRAGVLALAGAERGTVLPPEGSLSGLLGRLAEREDSSAQIHVHFPEEAREHPALAPLWSDFGKSRRLGSDSFFERIPPGATPLLIDDRDRPLVFSTQFGLGRAVLVASKNLWSLSAYAESQADRRFLEGFWLGVLDNLSAPNRSNRVSFELDPRTPSLGGQVSILVRDPALQPGGPVGGLQIRRGAAGEWRQLLLTPDTAWRGIGQAQWIPRDTGAHWIRYTRGNLEKRVEVTDRPLESGDETQDASFLRSLAESTGGRYYSYPDRAGVVDNLRFEKRALHRTEEKPLRHDALVGALIAALFCVGWGVRRAFSLP